MEQKRKRGLPKGRTNNPNGRPIGTKNKYPTALKEKLLSYLQEDFDKFVICIRSLHNKPQLYVKSYLEALKIILPRPRDEEELAKEEAARQSLLNRLFPGHYNNDDED